MTGELWAFAVVMVIGQFSPGPDMLLLTRTALVEGLRAGWWMVLGIVTGLTVHASVAIGGVAVMVGRGGWVVEVMSWAAAGYLFWLAWGLCRGGAAGEVGEKKGRSPFLRGLFCNLLNPKALIFFISVVAPFLVGERPWWWSWALWGLIVGEGLFFWALWVWVLQIPKVRRGYLRAGRVLDGIFAVVLILLALRLLFF